MYITKLTNGNILYKKLNTVKFFILFHKYETMGRAQVSHLSEFLFYTLLWYIFFNGLTIAISIL